MSMAQQRADLVPSAAIAQPTQSRRPSSPSCNVAWHLTRSPDINRPVSCRKTSSVSCEIDRCDTLRSLTARTDAQMAAATSAADLGCRAESDHRRDPDRRRQFVDLAQPTGRTAHGDRSIPSLPTTGAFRTHAVECRRGRRTIATVRIADGRSGALSIYRLQDEDWQHRSAYRDLPADDRQQLDRSLQELLYLVASTIRHQQTARRTAIPIPDAIGRRAGATIRLPYNSTRQHDPPTALVDQQTELRVVARLARPRRDTAHATGHRGTSDTHRTAASGRSSRSSSRITRRRSLDLERLHHDDPQDVLVAFLLGNSQSAQQHYHDCRAEFYPLHRPLAGRTHCLFPAGNMSAEAESTAGCRTRLYGSDFGSVLARRRCTSIGRSRAWQQGNLNGAIEDYTAVINLGRDDSLPFLLRSDAYALIGRD